MKPKHLPSPYTWKERRPLLSDYVFFVPDYYSHYEEFSFPGWGSIFGNENPVNIEYCSGNGSWILDKALSHPESNWVAVEKRFDRVRKIWSKLKNHDLKNLLIVSGEGFLFTQNYVPENTISEVFVNFPDPWPKDKHAKHRIISSKFVLECSRIMTPKGIMTLVTDDENYSQQMIHEVTSSKDFEACYPHPHYCLDEEGYGPSYFHDLWKEKGRMIYFMRFERSAYEDISSGSSAVVSSVGA